MSNPYFPEATMLQTIHGSFAAVTRTEDFDGILVTGHADPACPLAQSDGDYIDGILPTDRFSPCRICIGGEGWAFGTGVYHVPAGPTGPLLPHVLSMPLSGPTSIPTILGSTPSGPVLSVKT